MVIISHYRGRSGKICVNKHGRYPKGWRQAEGAGCLGWSASGQIMQLAPYTTALESIIRTRLCRDKRYLMFARSRKTLPH